MADVEKTRRRLNPEQRREQLLDVAVELAAGGDLAAVSVQHIAARAGVSEGLRYHYFPTKQALLLAAVRRAADAMSAAVAVAVTGTPKQALGAALRAYLDHVQSDPAGWRTLLHARTGAPAQVAQEVELQSRDLTLGLLGIAVPTPVVRIALNAWAALERQACLDWLDDPTVPRAAVEQMLLASFTSLLTAAAQHDDQARQVLLRLGTADEASQGST